MSAKKYLPAAALALAITLPNSASAQHTLKKITLERTRCFGTCPGYKVTISDDGTLTYRRVGVPLTSGDYRASIWIGCLKDLSIMFDKLGYWKFKPSYSASMTDLPWHILTAVSDKGTKTVREYGHHGPVELWACETLVDGLVSSANRWEKVPKRRTSSPPR